MFLKLAPSAACTALERRGRKRRRRGGREGGQIFKITARLICDIQRARRNKFQEITFILQRAVGGRRAHTHSPHPSTPLIFLTFGVASALFYFNRSLVWLQLKHRRLPHIPLLRFHAIMSHESMSPRSERGTI